MLGGSALSGTAKYGPVVLPLLPHYSPSGVDEIEVKLDSGEEWHSEPYELREGDIVTLSCRGNDKFYAGLFPREDYYELRGSEGGAFGFEFGTDRRGYTERVKVPEDEEYYIVLRVGVFTPGTTTLNVRFKIERPRAAAAIRQE